MCSFSYDSNKNILSFLTFENLSECCVPVRQFKHKTVLLYSSSLSYLYLIIFFDYRTLKAKRDAYVSHLNRIYRNNLDKVHFFLFLYHFMHVCWL